MQAVDPNGYARFEVQAVGRSARIYDHRFHSRILLPLLVKDPTRERVNPHNLDLLLLPGSRPKLASVLTVQDKNFSSKLIEIKPDNIWGQVFVDCEILSDSATDQLEIAGNLFDLTQGKYLTYLRNVQSIVLVTSMETAGMIAASISRFVK